MHRVRGQLRLRELGRGRGHGVEEQGLHVPGVNRQRLVREHQPQPHAARLREDAVRPPYRENRIGIKLLECYFHYHSYLKNAITINDFNASYDGP